METQRQGSENVSDLNPSKPQFRPQFCPVRIQNNKQSYKLWKLMSSYLPTDLDSIQKGIATHIEYNLARTRFSVDDNIWYQAVAYSVRDYLIEFANDTRRNFLAANKKRVYYFSVEYLPGRALKNALINLNLEENYKNALKDLGHDLERLYEEEHDAGIGNGGLGRLASCFLDSAATNNLPVWGYGIRYNYGIFKQKIIDGGQVEVPDYWLMEGHPWEVLRSDVKHKVQFYGKVRKETQGGKEKSIWEAQDEVFAVAYDTLVPGFDTDNTITLRLWSSKPTQEFDFECFNLGDYFKAVTEKQKAEFISSVLYPNDSTDQGKELRLQQQYFFVSASLQDLLWRFKVVNKNWKDLPSKVAIQLNDTHPSLSIVELLRILVDEENLEMELAWDLVTKVFFYTNHTVLPEALEKWTEELMGRMLPRHLELIHLINHNFLEEVRKKFPDNPEKVRAMSIIEETNPKRISMPHLSIIGSCRVNGVSKIHTNLLKTRLFRSFYEIFPSKFQNKTNGVTHRRWIACANPSLAEFYTDMLGTNEWMTNLDLIKNLIDKANDAEFRERWNEIKQKNKQKLIEIVDERTGIELREDAILDVMVKRIHEYKRQLMSALYVAYRYLQLKGLSPEERAKATPRSVLIAGKAAPGYVNAKRIIKLINMIADVVNKDPDTNEYLRLVFFSNYNVSHAERIIPAADICQHISTVGTEASGTSNMKFCMNGAILLGTMDGSNIEISDEVGEENIITFGTKIEEVDDIRHQVLAGKIQDDSTPEANKVIKTIQEGRFGENHDMFELMETIKGKNDLYLVRYDFKSYIEAQERVDELYKNREEWTKKSILNALKSSYFTSDRVIKEYAEDIWEVEPVKTKKLQQESDVKEITCHIEPNAKFGCRSKEREKS